MTHKRDEHPENSSGKKAHFPTPPWEKNKPKPNSTATAESVAEKENELKPAPEAPENVVKDTPKNSVEKPKPTPEVPEKTAEQIAAEKEALRASVEAFEKKVAEKKAAEDKNSAEACGDELCDENEKLAEDFEKSKAELQKTKEAYIRAVADFDNYRRRMNEERPKNMLYAKGDLAKDLFPVLDNFKLGIEAAQKHHPEAKEIIDGFSMIAAQLKNVLEQHGIVEINPVGKPFDPNEHESLSVMPSQDVPEDSVMFVHRVGYKIGDRLLRPASVVIAGK